MCAPDRKLRSAALAARLLVATPMSVSERCISASLPIMAQQVAFGVQTFVSLLISLVMIGTSVRTPVLLHSARLSMASAQAHAGPLRCCRTSASQCGSLCCRVPTGLIPAPSAHGRGLAPAATSAPGLGSPPAPSAQGRGLAPAASTPGLGSALPRLRRDWAHPYHICTGTGLSPATSAPGRGSSLPATVALGLCSPLPHVRRDRARPCLPQLHWDWTPCRLQNALGARHHPRDAPPPRAPSLALATVFRRCRRASCRAGIVPLCVRGGRRGARAGRPPESSTLGRLRRE
jgi:hypothetical protein